MKRSIIGVALALSLLLAPLAHAQTTPVPIGNPYTDTIQLWSEIASAISSLANDFASLFNGQEFAPHQPAEQLAAELRGPRRGSRLIQHRAATT